MEKINLMTWIFVFFSLVLGFIIGYGIRKYLIEMRVQSAKNEANSILENAQRDAESIKRESIIEAREEAHQIKEKVDQESKERRSELQRL